MNPAALSINRREMLAAASVAPLFSSAATAASLNNALLSSGSSTEKVLPGGVRPIVHLVADGLLLRPHEYSQILLELASAPDFRRDSEGQGGVVEELLNLFTEMTGKEKAVFMPSGTMANQFAIRILADGKSKVYVQESSHVLNNEGDAAQEMHSKRLMPLAPGKATFTLSDLTSDIDSFRAKEYFRTEIGAISIENPVRLNLEETFDIGAMRDISRFAQENGIGMHMDGARLHMASAYTGVSIREYASHFDTVYMSLYKYYGATAGAVLCGPASVIDKAPHLIKIAGGSMATNWPIAAVALHFARGFEARFREAKDKAAKLFKAAGAGGGISISPLPNGSNVFALRLDHGKYDAFAEHLQKEAGVFLRRKTPDHDFLPLKVNETLNLLDVDAAAAQFRAAYEAA